jgi:hypothetical protein
MNIKMKLIADWHQAWRWLSVQFIAAAAALQLALLGFPDLLRGYIPESWMHGIAIALLAAAVLGRLVDQKK